MHFPVGIFAAPLSSSIIFLFHLLPLAIGNHIRIHGCETSEMRIERGKLKYWKGEEEFKYWNVDCRLEEGGKRSLKFFLIGDNGGYEHEKNGHLPTPGQWSLAMVMRKYAKGEFGEIEGDAAGGGHHGGPFHPDFVLNLGDNFYEHGICEEDRERRFKEIFLNVFKPKGAEENPLAVHWHSIAGNNDYKVLEGEREAVMEKYGGKKQKNAAVLEERNKILFDMARARAKAQIGHPFEGAEGMWNFPSEQYIVHYHFSVPDGGNPVEVVIVMIDTVLICGASRKDFGTMPCKEKTAQSEQKLAWLKEMLANVNQRVKPDFLFVAGHYPLYVTETDRSFDCAKELQQIFAENNVDAYFAGHEHNLKRVEKWVDGKLVHQIVSGAASRMEDCQEPKHVANMGAHVKICYPDGIKKEKAEGDAHGNEQKGKKEGEAKDIKGKGVKEGGGGDDEWKKKKGLKRKKEAMEDKGKEMKEGGGGGGDDEWKKKKGLKRKKEAMEDKGKGGGAFISVQISRENAVFYFYAAGGKFYPTGKEKEEIAEWKERKAKEIIEDKRRSGGRGGGKVEREMVAELAKGLKIKMVGVPLVIANRHQRAHGSGSGGIEAV